MNEYWANVYKCYKKSNRREVYAHIDQVHESLESAVSEVDGFLYHESHGEVMQYDHTIHYKGGNVAIIQMENEIPRTDEDIASIAADMKCDLMRERDL